MSTCPICNATNYRIIGKPRPNSTSGKFLTADYRVVKCMACTGYYVAPRISFTDEQWAALYSEDYFAGQSEWLINKRHQELRRRLDKAYELTNSSGKINLLDIGTGEGKTLAEAYRRGWTATGIDVADNRVPEAKHENISFIKAKFLEYPLPEQHYDIIYLDSVLEHVLQPQDYLAKIKTLLKPNGVLYVAVPNEDCLFNDLRKLIYFLTRQSEIAEKIKPFDSPYHVIGFTRRSLTRIIRSHGLRVYTLRNFGRKFNFLGESLLSKSFWIKLLLLFPVEILGSLLRRDEYFETFILKDESLHP